MRVTPFQDDICLLCCSILHPLTRPVGQSVDTGDLEFSPSRRSADIGGLIFFPLVATEKCTREIVEKFDQADERSAEAQAENSAERCFKQMYYTFCYFVIAYKFFFNIIFFNREFKLLLCITINFIIYNQALIAKSA